MIIYMYVGGEYVDETKFLMKDVVNTFAFVWMLMKHDEAISAIWTTQRQHGSQPLKLTFGYIWGLVAAESQQPDSISMLYYLYTNAI